MPMVTESSVTPGPAAASVASPDPPPREQPVTLTRMSTAADATTVFRAIDLDMTSNLLVESLLRRYGDEPPATSGACRDLTATFVAVGSWPRAVNSIAGPASPELHKRSDRLG